LTIRQRCGGEIRRYLSSSCTRQQSLHRSLGDSTCFCAKVAAVLYRLLSTTTHRRPRLRFACEQLASLPTPDFPTAQPPISLDLSRAVGRPLAALLGPPPPPAPVRLSCRPSPTLSWKKTPPGADRSPRPREEFLTNTPWVYIMTRTKLVTQEKIAGLPG
jgi:hypothetical protein